jgi:hypothetical protein
MSGALVVIACGLAEAVMWYFLDCVNLGFCRFLIFLWFDSFFLIAIFFLMALLAIEVIFFLGFFFIIVVLLMAFLTIEVASTGEFLGIDGIKIYSSWLAVVAACDILVLLLSLIRGMFVVSCRVASFF